MKPILKKGIKEDVTQLQFTLNKLGIDTGDIDGIFGVKTEAAVKKFQTIFQIKVDGIVGKETYAVFDKLDKVKHFSINEFRCPCCKKVKINIDLLPKLEELRKAIGNKPIVITSGYRCLKYNTKCGGIKKSEHMVGKAADMQVKGMTPKEVYEKADKVFATGGVGLYKTFVHADIGPKYRWDRTK